MSREILILVKKASGFENCFFADFSRWQYILVLRPIREATYAFDLFSGFGNPAALPCHLEWPRFRPAVLCPALSVLNGIGLFLSFFRPSGLPFSVILSMPYFKQKSRV